MRLLVVFSFFSISCLGCKLNRFSTKKEKPKEIKVYNCDHRAPQAFVDKYKMLFDYANHDGDGVVTPAEVKIKIGALTNGHGRKEFDILPKDALAMVKEGDTNGDGVLSEKEWIKMFINIAIKKHMPDYKQSFELFDKNGDLKVTEHELVEVFKHVREVQSPHHLARKIMEGYECDGDNTLNFKEFVGFLASHNLGKDKDDDDDESEEENNEPSSNCQ